MFIKVNFTIGAWAFIGKARGADKKFMYDVEMSVCMSSQEGETKSQDFCPLNCHSLAHKLKICLLFFFFWNWTTALPTFLRIVKNIVKHHVLLQYILCRKVNQSENPQRPHVRLLPVDFHLHPAMLAGDLLPVCSWKETSSECLTNFLSRNEKTQQKSGVSSLKLICRWKSSVKIFVLTPHAPQTLDLNSTFNIISKYF